MQMLRNKAHAEVLKSAVSGPKCKLGRTDHDVKCPTLHAYNLVHLFILDEMLKVKPADVNTSAGFTFKSDPC